MKRLIIITLLFLTGAGLNAQLTHADLQATGLTCAMCSNAINKALMKVGFVESVKANIKHSTFDITFKKDVPVDLDAIKGAVEGAGFSVGKLKVTGNFSDVAITKDAHVKFGNEQFHFVDVAPQTLNGEKTILIVDKNFLSAKDFKKYSASTKLSCMQSGKAGSTCAQDGMAANTRIYHATINN